MADASGPSRRIAYVINSLEGGGAALPVPAVTRLMREHGARVVVYALTPRDRRALAPMLAAGLRVEVREGPEKDHLAAWRWLERSLRAARPDLIWTSLTRATLIGQQVGRRLRIPVVSWQHNAFLKPANRLLLAASQGLSGLWVADSTSVGLLTAERLGVPADRLAVWPIFGADPDAPQARPWRSGEVVRIGTLGRLHPAKGYDVLIEAARRLRTMGELPPFEILIAGEGAERAALAGQIGAAGLENVRLAGFVERPGAFLAGLNLYVQPSRREGLCIAAHEAMQAGLPAIVSDVGEMPYSVREGLTGLVAPSGDPQALAEALQALISRPEALAAMGQAARARTLERFGPEAFARAGAAVMARLP
jgi:glycosyltransferase involved in cell wall biosynthesis